MHRRVILCALPLGLAFAQDCSGCRSRDADDDRKVLARIETRKAMPIEVVAQKIGRHNGPCTATGGGRGGFSIMPFDQFTYTVQIDPMHYDGYKHGPIALSGGGDSVLFRTDSASERKDDPLADLRLQQCSDAKSRRVALRLRSSAAGTAPPGDDKWTVVYPFTKTIVLPKQKVEGSSCDDALSHVADPERWLVREMLEDNDHGALGIALDEGILLPEAMDHALRYTVSKQELDALVDAVKHDPALATHVLARLSPTPVTPPLAEWGAISMETLLDAISDETAKRDAVKKALSDCQKPEHLSECTSMRVVGLAYWAFSKKDQPSCDAAMAVVKALATHATTNGEKRALEILYRVSTCASEKVLRDALMSALDAKVAEGESLSSTCEVQNQCTADAEGVDLGDRETCNSLPGKAALWLAAHCDGAVVARAKALIAGKPGPAVEQAAACIVSRCGKNGK